MDAEAVVRLRAVIGKLARQFNASSTGEGLTPTQASVLGLVAARGPVSMAELTELEGLNPTMLSRVVSNLAEPGLIERKADPADLRAGRVEITDHGREVHERIKTERAAVVSECALRLSTSQVNSLVRALPALEALAAELRART
ncbi:MAG: transcriptional regulator, MarR family [Frankiales bacterium]|nr:transcriptional regulator, MarR family [Frankiales bacterium]